MRPHCTFLVDPSMAHTYTPPYIRVCVCVHVGVYKYPGKRKETPLQAKVFFYPGFHLRWICLVSFQLGSIGGLAQPIPGACGRPSRRSLHCPPLAAEQDASESSDSSDSDSHSERGSERDATAWAAGGFGTLAPGATSLGGWPPSSTPPHLAYIFFLATCHTWS